MTPESYGRTRDGETVGCYALQSPHLCVRILDYGGIVARIEVPDRNGTASNVVLGAADLAGYEASDAHFGAIIGRYANRIGQGRFTLDDETFQLAQNAGTSCMHGGPRGFDRHVWRVEVAEGRRLVLARRSPDGEEGFPGNLDVRVTYSLPEDDTLAIDYAAWTDRPTVINLTNHSYFNLAGESAGSVLDHQVAIDADAFLVTDAQQVPTGEIRAVEGTPFDFRTETALGARIRSADSQLALAHGYDHTYVLRPADGLRPVARAFEPRTGRSLLVATTQPSLQLYTGNMLDGTVTGSGGGLYRSGDAVCFEAQGFPNAPNRPGFPTTILRPNEHYAARTTYRFAVG